LKRKKEKKKKKKFNKQSQVYLAKSFEKKNDEEIFIDAIYSKKELQFFIFFLWKKK
jgi:hypothetical protein